MNFYIKINLKISTIKLRTDKCSKVTGYKTSIQESAAFLYTTKKSSEMEFKKTTLLTIA